MADPRLSVVIPSRDGRELLSVCLPPLLAELESLGEAEVIVVDDRSDDGSIEFLRASFPEVRVCELGEGAGFAAACNAGARVARAGVTAFLNNDAEVRPGWAGALLDALDTDPRTVIVGGLTLFAGSPAVVNTAGVMVTPSGAAADIGFGCSLDAVDLTPREVAAVSGVSMAVRREWFASSGGFEEQLFMYFEDVELCLRAWREGHSVRFAPDSVVLHRGAATAGARHEQLRNHYGSRNRILVAALCLDREQLPVALVSLLAQDVASVLRMLAGGRVELAWSTARDRALGVIGGIRRMGGMRRERLAQRRYVRSFSDLRRRGLIAGWNASLHEFARIQRLR